MCWRRFFTLPVTGCSLSRRCAEDTALEMGAAPRRIVANLPYNIATTLLIQWLGRATSFETMTLMFQREVPNGSPHSPATALMDG